MKDDLDPILQRNDGVLDCASASNIWTEFYLYLFHWKAYALRMATTGRSKTFGSPQIRWSRPFIATQNLTNRQVLGMANRGYW